MAKASRAANNETKYPKVLGDLLKVYIYAGLADIDAGGDRDLASYENYENIIKKKDDDPTTGLTPRFNISPQVKKVLSKFLSGMLKDVREVDLLAADKLEAVTHKVSDGCDEATSYTAHMYEMTQSHWADLENGFGLLSRSNIDSTNWCKAQIEGVLLADTSKYKGQFELVATIVTAFDRFMKVIAMYLAMFLSIDPKPLSLGLFCGLMTSWKFGLGTVQLLAAEILADEKPKKPSVRKAGAKAKAADGAVDAADAKPAPKAPRRGRGKKADEPATVEAPVAGPAEPAATAATTDAAVNNLLGALLAPAAPAATPAGVPQEL